MPKGSQLHDFGPEFEQLLLRVDKSMAGGREEFVIDFADPKIAHALRFRIYGYFKALRSCAARPDLTAMSTGLSMRLAGCSIVFYHRGEDKETAALRDALGLEKGFEATPGHAAVLAPTSPLTDHLTQLRAMRTTREKN